MAYTVLNTVSLPTEFVGLPSVQQKPTGVTSVSATDLGTSGLRFIRVRIVVNSGMANTNTAIFVVRVGTGTGVTAPEVVITSPTLTFVTGDSKITWEGYGYSNNGFQSYSISVTNSGGTANFDALVSCE